MPSDLIERMPDLSSALTCRESHEYAGRQHAQPQMNECPNDSQPMTCSLLCLAGIISPTYSPASFLSHPWDPLRKMPKLNFSATHPFFTASYTSLLSLTPLRSRRIMLLLAAARKQSRRVSIDNSGRNARTQQRRGKDNVIQAEA